MALISSSKYRSVLNQDVMDRLESNFNKADTLDERIVDFGELIQILRVKIFCQKHEF